jgi:hypothetical protein
MSIGRKGSPAVRRDTSTPVQMRLGTNIVVGGKTKDSELLELRESQRKSY